MSGDSSAPSGTSNAGRHASPCSNSMIAAPRCCKANTRRLDSTHTQACGQAPASAVCQVRRARVLLRNTILSKQARANQTVGRRRCCWQRPRNRRKPASERAQASRQHSTRGGCRLCRAPASMPRQTPMHACCRGKTLGIRCGCKQAAKEGCKQARCWRWLLSERAGSHLTSGRHLETSGPRMRTPSQALSYGAARAAGRGACRAACSSTGCGCTCAAALGHECGVRSALVCSPAAATQPTAWTARTLQ